MKIPRIANAISYIDDDFISGTTRAKVVKQNAWLKLGAIAACFAVIVLAAMVAIPMMLGGDDSASPIDNSTFPSNNEYVYAEKYFYSVDEGIYSTYVGGKVIAEDKIGNQIADVSISAGWKNNAGEWISEIEKLRGEVYAINGVSDDVAVALKFIDQGEAVTTTHYYVIMNPNADLTVVEDYIIVPDVPQNPDNEMAGGVNE